MTINIHRVLPAGRGSGAVGGDAVRSHVDGEEVRICWYARNSKVFCDNFESCMSRRVEVVQRFEEEGISMSREAGRTSEEA